LVSNVPLIGYPNVGMTDLLGNKRPMSGKSKDIAIILNKAILDHRLMPGAKLGERELSELFDVSRIVIRQALVRLSEEGIVSIERNRGAFVIKPSLQDARDVYDAASILEQGAIAQLSHRLSPTARASLRQHLEMQRKAIADDNQAMADVLGQQFHLLLIKLSQNRVIIDFYEQLSRKILLIRSLYRAEFDYKHLLEDHERLVDLIERRRFKQTQDLLHSHNRLVSNSYVLEEQSQPSRGLAEALAPYLGVRDGKGDTVAWMADHKRPGKRAKH
jgi:DNA-binding GntR family transcriptional regulator